MLTRKSCSRKDAVRELFEDYTEDDLAATDPKYIKHELDSSILKKILWGYMEFIPMINADRNRGLWNFLLVIRFLRGKELILTSTCMQSLSQLVQGKDHSRRGGRMPYKQ